MEFALLAPLMFALIFVVFEISWRYYVQSTAETAVVVLAARLADPARRLSDTDAIKAEICANARVLPCGKNDTGFRVQVVQLTATTPGVQSPVQDRVAIVPGRANVIRVIHEHASIAPTGVMKTLGMAAAPVFVTAAFWAR
ncbi:TadE/TadG family type IV pilus assembly protein [Alsobacter metallidurans]|uniref:TadE/TadG family type IV pilus assembly protein n=1 Tax=Alsobacter metallidurans TaxID=340221 RepID=UPI00166B7743|nr:TadE/TadG family type IV pilus assembly protein [Alsobacter metallidurans]